MATVEAPAGSVTAVIVGVQFVDGVAETTDPVALGYFRRAGYTVNGAVGRTKAQRAAFAESVRLAGQPVGDAYWENGLVKHLPVNVGGHLQDAAEDPGWEAPPPS